MDSVLYVSSLCSAQMERDILSYNANAIGLQVQKYHRLLAQGFCQNGLEVTALSYHKKIQEVSDKTSEKDGKINYQYLHAAEYSKASHVSVLIKSFIRTWKYFRKHKNAFMICDVLNLSISFGALLAAKMLGQEAIGIVTDFPELCSGDRVRKKGLYWWLIDHCTGYVLLTENMKEHVNIDGKKSTVLEGHVDSSMAGVENTVHGKWEGIHCIYAGGIHKQYGIETLVQAFIEAGIPGSRLHIYGNGDFSDELISMNNEHIVYHGVVPNVEVVQAEICATLLINPRPTTEEFTKYSFPSKNMEYMASGTPVLTTKLPGMPEEYCPYVYLFEDETVKGMAQTLQNVLRQSKEALHAKGEEARRFVLMEKNNIVQAEKIIRMVEED